MSEEEIIKGCLKNKRKAQEAFYQTYAPRLMPICMRYARQTHEAEDIMHQGFLKAFKYLHTFKGQSNLYSWLKRVFINVAIKHYRKNKKHYNQSYDNEVYQVEYDEVNVIEQLKKEDLLTLINTLPDGYRMVFNLYVIEGYKHREIAEMLAISAGTSKSQLAKAKQLLRDKLEHLQEAQEKSMERYAR